MRRRLVIIAAAMLFLIAFDNLRASNDQLRRPISLDKTEPGDLYALDASGIIFRLAVSNSGLEIKGSFRLPPFAYPADVVSAHPFGQLMLLITTNNQKAGFVSQFSSEGKLQHVNWPNGWADTTSAG